MFREADGARSAHPPAAAETTGLSARDVIAVEFDLDDTLVPGSTSQRLEGLGVDVDTFWRETLATLVRDGWDPAGPYLHHFLSLREDGVPPGLLARQRLIEAGEGAGREDRSYKGSLGVR